MVVLVLTSCASVAANPGVARNRLEGRNAGRVYGGNIFLTIKYQLRAVHTDRGGTAQRGMPSINKTSEAANSHLLRHQKGKAKMKQERTPHVSVPRQIKRPEAPPQEQVVPKTVYLYGDRVLLTSYADLEKINPTRYKIFNSIVKNARLVVGGANRKINTMTKGEIQDFIYSELSVDITRDDAERIRLNMHRLLDTMKTFSYHPHKFMFYSSLDHPGDAGNYRDGIIYISDVFFELYGAFQTFVFLHELTHPKPISAKDHVYFKTATHVIGNNKEEDLRNWKINEALAVLVSSSRQQVLPVTRAFNYNNDITSNADTVALIAICLFKANAQNHVLLHDPRQDILSAENAKPFPSFRVSQRSLPRI